MGPHFISRHTAIRLMLVAVMSVLLLPACTKGTEPDHVSATTSDLSGEWVDTKALFSQPANFLTRGQLRLYLEGVNNHSWPSDSMQGHWNILPRDIRLESSDPMRWVVLAPSAKKIWENAHLEPDYEYGVTFSGRVKSFGDANYKWYAFVVDDLEINSEARFSSKKPGQIASDYRPAQILALPRPQTIEDSKRFSLLANDYVGRKVRLDLRFSARELQVSQRGVTFIQTADVSLELNETLVREVVDKMQDWSSMDVIGKVLKERDETGRVRIEVTSLEKRSEY